MTAIAPITSLADTRFRFHLAQPCGYRIYLAKVYDLQTWRQGSFGLEDLLLPPLTTQYRNELVP
jgi:hypothetical protein